MSRVVEPGICDCSCHNPHARTYHCVPCCQLCPTCRRNVERGFIGDEHIKKCKERLDDLIAQYEAEVRSRPDSDQR